MENINKKEIVRSITTLHEKGTVFEIRALEAISSSSRKPHAIQGFFNNPDKVVEQIGIIKSAMGIYITLNPVNPALLSRANNRFVEYQKDYGTADKDIIKRNWLLIDCDPVRPSNISSSETELEASKNRAVEVYNYLELHGWGQPVSGYSGNGFHLLYKIDLPVDDAGLVKKVLEALNHHFSDKVVSIDTAVFNPARITKLYGTLTCKGDNTIERPHRMSKLRLVPAELKTVSKEMLEKVAGTFEAEPSKTVINFSSTNNFHKEFNLSDFITKHNIQTKAVKNKGSMTIIELQACPWGQQHGSGDKPGDSCIIQFANGAVGFKCQHNTCSNRTWKDFRLLFEPGYNDKKTEYNPSSHPIILPKFFSAPEICSIQFPPTRWVVPELIPEGLTILAGKPKTGKSWAVLDLALQVASGGKVFGKILVEKGHVLYLALEDSKRRLQKRMNILLEDKEPPANLQLVDATTGWKTLNKGGLEMLEKTIQEHPDIKMIAIDTLQKIKPIGQRQNNAYENDYAAIGDLQKLATKHNISIILLHHLRKSISKDGDIFDEVSGSLGLTGASDTVIVIKRKRNSNDAILALSGRDILERELAIYFDKQTCRWSVIGDARDTCITRERQEILDVLQQTTGTLDAQEIHGGLEQMGVSKTPAAVRWLLRQMVEAEEIENPVRGRYCIPTNNKQTYQQVKQPEEEPQQSKPTYQQTNNSQTNKPTSNTDEGLWEPIEPSNIQDFVSSSSSLYLPF